MKPRTYNYRYQDWFNTLFQPITSEEIKSHVLQATRDLPDPIFLNLAHQAAIRGLNCHYTGLQGLTFHYPTNHPTGYYSILSYIALHPNIRRKDIYSHFHTAPATTLTRLLDANLIQNQNHRYSATELGQCFLLAAKPYLTTRAILRRLAS